MCPSCKKLSHVSINNSTEMNEKFVLACLHTGTGHSHFYSYLNIVGLPSITDQKFKSIERKVGKEIEQVEEESYSHQTVHRGKVDPGVSELPGAMSCPGIM